MAGRRRLLEGIYMGDFTPKQECSMTGGLILLRRQMRAAATKNIVDLGVRRQKTLG